jgi:hypothetical protein
MGGTVSSKAEAVEVDPALVDSRSLGRTESTEAVHPQPLTANQCHDSVPLRVCRETRN